MEVNTLLFAAFSRVHGPNARMSWRQKGPDYGSAAAFLKGLEGCLWPTESLGVPGRSPCTVNQGQEAGTQAPSDLAAALLLRHGWRASRALWASVGVDYSKLPTQRLIAPPSPPPAEVSRSTNRT